MRIASTLYGFAWRGRGLVQWRGYREWENYTSSSGLASDAVHGILPQPNGPIWVGADGGLMRGERRNVAIEWKKVAGLEGLNVTVVREGSDGALWIGYRPNWHRARRPTHRQGEVAEQRAEPYKVSLRSALRSSTQAMGWEWMRASLWPSLRIQSSSTSPRCPLCASGRLSRGPMARSGRGG